MCRTDTPSWRADADVTAAVRAPDARGRGRTAGEERFAARERASLPADFGDQVG